jgi:cholesterol oxidase
MSNRRALDNYDRTAWISRGFEELAASRDCEPATDTVDFDVVIVGSGYGGAIAAAQLAGATDERGRKISVCVLERGREYLPGMFPSKLSELAAHVRFSTEGGTCARGEREGLFDVRIGSDVSAVVANGLGGGSLINAGVMATPGDDVFQRREWPALIRNESTEERQQRFNEVRVLLGAALLRDGSDPVDNTVRLNPDKIPAKYRVLERMAPKPRNGSEPFRPAAITVALTKDRESSARVRLNECLRCGDCATGCNHGAKDSLDVNLLRTAEQAGAQIFTGATVLRLEQHHPRSGKDSNWLLDVVHTDLNLRARQGGPFRLVARKVILAAGTYGSTEILLRSRSESLVFSRHLGQRFSTNGDMIAVAYDQHDRRSGTRVEVNAIADERDPPQARKVGPTITGIIDLRDDNEKVVIEEMAIPGPLRRVFEEVVTTGNVLRSLARIDDSAHGPNGPDHDPCAVERGAIKSSSIFAIMGNDGAKGALELISGEEGDEKNGDGAVRVRWPEARDHPIFQQGINSLQALGKASHIDAEVQSNPIWQLLPEEMQFLFDDRRGALLTVHPLGGCPMGDAAGPVLEEPPKPDRSEGVDGSPAPTKEASNDRLLTQGVVNDLGQVFDGAEPPATLEVFPTLVVLDGSIVPTSLGINPSLTIASLALRAIKLLREKWQWKAPGDAKPAPSVRPVFQTIPDPPKPAATEVEIIERMSGEALLPAARGGTKLARVELTLHFKPVPLASLFLPLHGKERTQQDATAEAKARVEGKVPMKRPLEVDPGKSRLRVFDAEKWNEWRKSAGSDRELENIDHISAHLSGTLVFMQREASTYPERRCRGLHAWIMNRGLRDTWQALASLIKDWRSGIRLPPLPPLREGQKLSFWGRLPLIGPLLRRFSTRIEQLYALASHAGEVRLFDYDLAIDRDTLTPPAKCGFASFGDEQMIRGRKRLTYSRRSNPWRQMARMSLDAFPGLHADSGAYLDLDLTYLTQEGVPLLRVVKQEDQVAAIADLGSLAGYFLRLLMSVHVWSFRKPDPADPGEPQRLPGKIKGLDGPEISEFVVANLPDGRPVRARLTRYPRRTSTRPPLLMIPGYSASGTTFAHPVLDPHAAGYFWERGRDVWILDMRTSCGMPTARLPWTFEEAALADIPKAIDFIWHATEKQRFDASPGNPLKIDVLAHCMGSVMFSMALLAPPEAGDPYFRERETLPGRVGKVVLSQIGPVVVFTPDNVFRAYLMSYLRNFLPLTNYEFRIGPAPSLTDQLIDRFLAAMPYPENEFDIENPWWPPCKRTPWVGSRHRMDALYGRDFNVENVSGRVLDAIDDLFGPLSTDTVSQAIHFARLGVLTNRAGRNVFVTRRNLLERWTRVRPTLSLHGEKNGLYDISTLARMTKLFKTELGLSYETRPLEAMGHQDCLIGKKARKVFVDVEEFLDRGE